MWMLYPPLGTNKPALSLAVLLWAASCTQLTCTQLAHPTLSASKFSRHLLPGTGRPRLCPSPAISGSLQGPRPTCCLEIRRTSLP